MKLEKNKKVEVTNQIIDNGLIEYIAIKKKQKILEKSHYKLQESYLFSTLNIPYEIDISKLTKCISKPKDMIKTTNRFFEKFEGGDYENIEVTYGWFLIDVLDVLLEEKNFNDFEPFNEYLVKEKEKLKNIKSDLLEKTTYELEYSNNITPDSIKDVSSFVQCLFTCIFNNINLMKSLFNTHRGIEDEMYKITCISVAMDDIILHELSIISKGIVHLEFMKDYPIYKKLMDVNKIKILCPEIEAIYKEYIDEFNNSPIIKIYEMIMLANDKFSDKYLKTLNIRNNYLHGDYDFNDQNMIHRDLKILEFLLAIMLVHLLVKRKVIIINLER